MSFTHISDTPVHHRYLTVLDRVTLAPNNKEIKWDVAGHHIPYPTYAVVLPFCSKTQTITLVNEFAQGVNANMWTLPAGVFERKKSSSIEECAKSELNEEAKLKGGRWIRLLPPDHEGISELKWSINKYIPFLVIDPEEDASPEPVDSEEFIKIKRGISIKDVVSMIMRGEIMLPSVQTIVMCIHKLKEIDLLKGDYI